MRELWERGKAAVTLPAVICIIAGMLVMIWPAQTSMLLCRALAFILLIMGIANILTYLADQQGRRFMLFVGGILTVLGLVILVRPSLILQILSIVIGVVLILHGLKDMQLVAQGKEYEEKQWWLPSLFSTVTIVLGVSIIWNYLQTAVVIMWLLGLALVFDGISALVILEQVSRAQKAARQEEEAIDVEFKE